MQLGVIPRMDTKKHMFKRDGTTCSKFVIHSMLNDQYNWGEHIFNECVRILTLVKNHIFIQAL